MSDPQSIVEIMNRSLQLGVVVQSETAQLIGDALEKHAENLTTAGIATGVLIALTYAFQHVVQVDPKAKGKSAVNMVRVLLDGLEPTLKDLPVLELLRDMTKDADLEHRVPAGSA